MERLASVPPDQRAAWEIKYFHLQPDWFIALPSFLVVLVTVSLGLRVYVRALMIRAFGKDDWVLMVAYLIFIADSGIYITIGIIQKSQGLIRPVRTLQILAISSTLGYLCNQVFIKIALGYFFLRVVNPGWQQWTIKSAVIVYVVYSGAFSLVVLFHCGLPTPEKLSSGNCINWKTILGPLNYLAAALNAVVDWILTIVPIYVVSKVNMTRSEKISVSVLMLFGVIGSIVSVVRIPYVKGVAPTADLSYFWRVIPISLCSIVEIAMCIAAISLAALRPLYARIFDVTSNHFSSGASRNQKAGYAVTIRSNPDTTCDRAHVTTSPESRARWRDTPNFSLPWRTYTNAEKESTPMDEQWAYPMTTMTNEARGQRTTMESYERASATPSVATTIFPIQRA